MLIVSDWFFDETVRHYPNTKPSCFRPVRVVIKETDMSAWVRVIEIEKTLAQPDSEQTASASVFSAPATGFSTKSSGIIRTPSLHASAQCAW